MMYPPIFTLVQADPGVQSSFGVSPVRVFPFGGAPEGVDLPYAVWQVIPGGGPENYIGNAPDMDKFLVQFDVYADTATAARDGAESLILALQQHAHIVAWRGETKDVETQHYRFSFDVQFLTAR